MTTTKRLTVNQVGNMLIFIASGIKLISFPSIAYGLTGRDSWIFIILMVIIDTLALLFILKITKLDPDLTFYKFLTKTVGKWVAKVIFALLALVIFIRLMLMFQEMKSFFIDTLYRDFSCPMFLVPACALLLYSASVGIRAIGRTVETLVVFAVLSGITVMFYGMGSADFLNIFPILENGLSPLPFAIYKSTYAFGDVALIFLFLGNIKIEKGYQKKILGRWVFGSILMIGATFLFFNTFDVISGVYQFALTDVAKVDYQRINTGGLNSVITIGLTFGLFAYAAILFYCCYAAIAKVIKVKNKYHILFPLMAGIVFILFVSHFNIAEGRLLIKPWMRVISLFFQLVFPFSIPLLIKIYKRKKKEVSYEKTP